jgi:hypothetical protein
MHYKYDRFRDVPITGFCIPFAVFSLLPLLEEWQTILPKTETA